MASTPKASKDVIAAHDGEIGFGGGDFAETHVAAVSGVEFGLDVGVCEEDEIEGAWLGPIVQGKRWQGCSGARTGKCLQEISAIELHSRFISIFCGAEMLARRASGAMGGVAEFGEEGPRRGRRRRGYLG